MTLAKKVMEFLPMPSEQPPNLLQGRGSAVTLLLSSFCFSKNVLWLKSVFTVILPVLNSMEFTAFFVAVSQKTPQKIF